MRYLWRFYFPCGRMGSLDGLFVATEEEVQKVIGQYVYFGEVLGKHSEVYGTLKQNEITKVDLDSETVEKVAKILGDNWSGFNPLEYVKCDECGERAEYCEDGFNGFVDGVCKYCRENGEDDKC